MSTFTRLCGFVCKLLDEMGPQSNVSLLAIVFAYMVYKCNLKYGFELSVASLSILHEATE